MDEITHLALQAHLQAYYALVRTLHENGVLPISAVVNQMGDRADFGKTSLGEPDNPVARVIYDGLFELEQQYIRARFVPPGSPSPEP